MALCSPAGYILHAFAGFDGKVFPGNPYESSDAKITIDWVKRMQAERAANPDVKNFLTVVPLDQIVVLADGGFEDMHESMH